MKQIIMLTIVLIVNAFANDVKFFETSYDCEKTTLNKVEQAVCRNETLANLDVELYWVYRSFKPINQTLKKEQLKWMQKRNECKTTECIEKVYRHRITELYKKSSLVVFKGNKKKCKALLNDYYHNLQLVPYQYYNEVKKTNDIIKKCDAKIREVLKPTPPEDHVFPVRHLSKVYEVDYNNDGKKETVVVFENYASYRLQWRDYYKIDDKCSIDEIYSDYTNVSTKFISWKDKIYFQEHYFDADMNHFYRFITEFDKNKHKFIDKCEIVTQSIADFWCLTSSSHHDYCGKK